jgi:type II pantothenate kinase
MGIDAGGTLIKIAYEEKGRMHYKTYSYDAMESLITWIKLLSGSVSLSVTGGRADEIKALLGTSRVVAEFEAVTKGGQYLYQTNKGKAKSFLLINIGTGTSFYSVTNEKSERLLGSGIGGGTILGLSCLLNGPTDFQEIVKSAEQGNHETLDLLVKDIYKGETPILGHLTASNFGKSVEKEVTTQDQLAALFTLIGETIVLLATNTLPQENERVFVFVGGAIENNKPLQKIMESFSDQIKVEMVFIENGSYAGAIGALLNA